MSELQRKRAPGGGRKPKREEDRYLSRTVTLPPAIAAAVEHQQQAGETFSAVLARLLASHPAIAQQSPLRRSERACEQD